MTFKVLVDTREKKPWFFGVNQFCSGSEIRSLKTGDYTIEGYEDLVCVERKRSTAEIAQNIVDERWDNELVRLNQFKYAYIVLEFTADNVMEYPLGTSIPKRIYSKLKVNGSFIMHKLIGYMIKYPNIKVIFAGTQAKEIAEIIFKRVVQNEKNK
jgi:ERCC4-type nuclease